jgi:hypothetical protein
MLWAQPITNTSPRDGKEKRSNLSFTIDKDHSQSDMDIAAIVVKVAGDAVPVPGLKSAATLVLEIMNVINVGRPHQHPFEC